jgi:aspartate-semialdehyde dehydrogenase
MPIKLRVRDLGATFRQRFVEMLERHPQFDITAVAASERFENKLYGEACSWRSPKKSRIWSGAA